MISCNHIYRNADALCYGKLVARAVNCLDQSPAKFPCVLEIERRNQGRGARLFKRVDCLHVDCSTVGQQRQLADRFAGRKQKCPLVEIDLDFEFGFDVATRRGVGLTDIAFLSCNCYGRQIVEFLAKPRNSHVGGLGKG